MAISKNAPVSVKTRDAEMAVNETTEKKTFKDSVKGAMQSAHEVVEAKGIRGKWTAFMNSSFMQEVNDTFSKFKSKVSEKVHDATHDFTAAYMAFRESYNARRDDRRYNKEINDLIAAGAEVNLPEGGLHRKHVDMEKLIYTDGTSAMDRATELDAENAALSKENSSLTRKVKTANTKGEKLLDKYNSMSDWVTELQTQANDFASKYAAEKAAWKAEKAELLAKLSEKEGGNKPREITLTTKTSERELPDVKDTSDEYAGLGIG
ncbi:hypothetical protein J6A31_04780 [bacterium]|nr:hypothetical protein [bacterium]